MIKSTYLLTEFEQFSALNVPWTLHLQRFFVFTIIVLLVRTIFILGYTFFNRLYGILSSTHHNDSVVKVPGNFFQFLAFDSETFLERLCYYEKYGKFVEFYQGWKKCLFISDSAIAREIMLRRPKGFARLQDTYASKFIGLDQSVLNLEGAKWMQVRKIINPTFSRFHVARQYEKIVLESYRWMKRMHQEIQTWAGDSDKTVDMIYEPFTFTIRAISILAFGISSSETKPFHSYFFSTMLFDDVKTLLSFLGFSVRSWFTAIFWGLLPLQQSTYYAYLASKRFTEHCWLVIKHSEERNEKLDNDTEDVSLIDNLIFQFQKGEISAAQLLANVKIAYIGGTDTTAVTISWACYYLSLYPDYQTKIREEMKRLFDSVFSEERLDESGLTESDFVKALTYESVHEKLMFTQAFVKETLRLKPPVSALMFQPIDKELNLSNGINVSSYDIIIINQEGILTSPEIYPNPYLFYPERWLDEKSEILMSAMNQGFIPFGGGARICPGMHLALEEAVLAVGMLSLCFHLSLGCEEKQIHRVSHLIAEPTKMPIVFKPLINFEK